MGTQYILLEKEGVEFSLYEMSTKYSFDMGTHNEQRPRIEVDSEVDSQGVNYVSAGTSTFLTSEDLIEMAAKMVQAASYQMEDEDDAFPLLKKRLKELYVVWED